MIFKTRYGVIKNPLKVYVDPHEGDDVKVKYKGKTAFDSGAFYAPYIPLQMSWPDVNGMRRRREADSRRWWMRLIDGGKPALVFLNALRSAFNRRR